MNLSPTGHLFIPGRRFLHWFARELETNRRVWLVLFALFYLAQTGFRSFTRFWYDELFTYNVATLSGPVAMWDALVHGADLNPPLFYWITHAFLAVFGNTEFGLRTPAILGFGVACGCLYVFVARRAGPGFGFVAMLVPLVTGATRWSHEARPYGLMLGFCGLALLSWQRAAEPSAAEPSAAEPSRRLLTLAGLTLSLAAMLLSHCFAVLMLLPFFLAQLVRDYGRRKLDWPMWVSLALPLSACLTYLPLFATSKQYDLKYYHQQPGLHTLLEFIDTMLTPALWPLLLGMAIIAVGAAWRSRKYIAPSPLWSAAEMTLASVFLLVPIAGIILSQITVGEYMSRYGIAAVIAVALLFAQAAATLTRRSKVVAAALVVIVLGFSAGGTAVQLAEGWSAVREPALPLEQHTELPLVISSGLILYPMSHYATPQQQARLWFLTDQDIAFRLTGSSMFEKGLPVLDRQFPMHVHFQDYHQFLAAHPHFLLYGYADFKMDWLIPQLQADGASLRYLGKQMDQMGLAVFYDVEAPARSLAARR